MIIRRKIMLSPLLRKVDCIRLSVKDLDSGIEFYRDRLGLELIWKTQQAVGLRMPDDTTEIVLHCEPKVPEIDLKVQSADDAANQFEKAGGEVVVPSFDIQIGRCVVVRDPWGNELVLLDSSKGLLKIDSEGNVLGNMQPT
jgi:lactoylglutathione lyase